MNAETEGRLLAENLRQEHDLAGQPLGDIPTFIEQNFSLDVAVLAVSCPDEHGFTAIDPESGVAFIAAATTGQPFRQRFTLLHELCHYLTGDTTNQVGAQRWSERTPPEIRADSFARHLMAPLSAVRSQVGPRPVELATLSALVRHFEISPQPLLIQLAECGMISSAQKNEWWQLQTAPRLATRFGWRAQYEAAAADSMTPRAPRQLLARATEGYRQGVVSLETLARLRGIAAPELLAALEDAGVTPAPNSATFETPDLSGFTDPFDDLSDLDDSEVEG